MLFPFSIFGDEFEEGCPINLAEHFADLDSIGPGPSSSSSTLGESMACIGPTEEANFEFESPNLRFILHERPHPIQYVFNSGDQWTSGDDFMWDVDRERLYSEYVLSFILPMVLGGLKIFYQFTSCVRLHDTMSSIKSPCGR